MRLKDLKPLCLCLNWIHLVFWDLERLINLNELLFKGELPSEHEEWSKRWQCAKGSLLSGVRCEQQRELLLKLQIFLTALQWVSHNALPMSDGMIQLAGELLEPCLQWRWHFVLVMSVGYTEVFGALCRVWAWHLVFFIRGPIVPSRRLCSGSARKDEHFSRRWHTRAEEMPVPVLSQGYTGKLQKRTIPLSCRKQFPFPTTLMRHFQAVGREDGRDGSPSSFLSLAPHATHLQKDE